MSNPTRAAILFSLLTACVAVLPTVGCSGSTEPVGRVSGKVTYQGNPVAEGTVIFSSSSVGASAEAEIGADGSYMIETHTGGLPPGDYMVTILPPEIPDPSSGGDTEVGTITKQVKDIPKAYRSLAETPLSVIVNDGDNEIDLPME